MTVLKCDFDGRVPGLFTYRLAFVCRVHRLRVMWWEIHRTRNGYHVVIHVAQRVSFARVILLQAVLGSDWRRETFNSRRANAWRNVPAFWRNRANVLYQRHYHGVEQ